MLDKLIKKAGFVVGMDLDIIEAVAERRITSKLLAITNNTSHHFQDIHVGMKFIQQSIDPALVNQRLLQEVIYAYCCETLQFIYHM